MFSQDELQADAADESKFKVFMDLDFGFVEQEMNLAKPNATRVGGHEYDETREKKQLYSNENVLSDPDYGELDSEIIPSVTCKDSHTLMARFDIRLSMKNAFDILHKAMKGDFDENIPMREGASPIYPDESCFYVFSKGTMSHKKKRRRSQMSQSSSISVKYQSFNEKNCQVWWSPESENRFGVVSRSMSKVARPKKGELNSKNRNHGYGGRYYQLVRRPDSNEEFERTCKSATKIKGWVIDQVPGLVQFWRLDSSVVCEKAEEQSVVSSGSSTTFNSGEISDFIANNVVRTDLRVEGDMIVDGETVVRNLHVRGNLLVEGCISGQLVTPPGAADYAEWFAYLNQEEKILPGMVVQLRSPEQKITLDTSGHGPHLIVSTTPSVAAGVPPSLGGKQAAPGALCAFLGQVPVNVIGPVRCGQYLFPSKNNDGYAVARGFYELDEDDENEPLGTAMVSCGEGKHTILSFIRWQHNLKYQILKRKKGQLESGLLNIWTVGTIVMVECLCEYIYLSSRPHLVLDWYSLMLSLCLHVYALSHFPRYSLYFTRGDIFFDSALSCIKMAVAFYRLLAMLGSTDPDFIVADAIIPIITIFGRATWMRESFHVANSPPWRDMKCRKEHVLWIAYDVVSKYLSDSVLGCLKEEAVSDCPVAACINDGIDGNKDKDA